MRNLLIAIEMEIKFAQAMGPMYRAGTWLKRRRAFARQFQIL